MKRKISVLLAIVFLLSTLTVSASAEAADKLSPRLAKQLEAMADDEKVAVHVTSDLTIDDAVRNAIYQQIGDEVGVTPEEEEAFLAIDAQSLTAEEKKAYNLEKANWSKFHDRQHARLKEARKDLISAVLDALGIAAEDMDDGKYKIESLDLPEKLYLTNEQIVYAASMDAIKSIDLYTEPVVQKPYTDPDVILSDRLKKQMQEMNDTDRIEVYISYYTYGGDSGLLSNSEQRKRAYEMYGSWTAKLILGNPYYDYYNTLYHKAVNQIGQDYIDYINLVRIDNLSLSDEDIISYANGVPRIGVLNLTKEKIYDVIERDGYILSVQTYEELKAYEERPTEDPTEPPTEPDETAYFCKDRVLAQYPFLFDYSELYYHTDETGEIDWVLITGYEGEALPQTLYQVIGNRIVIEEMPLAPFSTGFGVYDVKNDVIKPVYQSLLSEYDGLEEVFNRLGGGKLIGDINDDNELDAVDVTLMQRCTLNIRDYPEWDEVITDPYEYEYITPTLTYYSDFNRDGERDVVDVTLLQRYILGIPVTLADGTVLAG